MDNFIKNIEIKDWVLLKDIEIKTDASINVFIGDNGTGKSQLLGLINAYGKGIEEERDRVDDEGEDVSRQRMRKYVRDYLKHSTRDLTTYITVNQTKFKYTHHPETTGRKSSKKIKIEVPEETQYRNTVYIPAKEVLSLSWMTKLGHFGKRLSLNPVYPEIITAAQQLELQEIASIGVAIVPQLEQLINGRVVVMDDDSFWIEKVDGTIFPLDLEAEGFRKVGLLWLLLMNEQIAEGTVLVWDEPEANLNPKLIPVIANILLILARQGVQIFLATHDYFLPQYLNTLKEDTDELLFHSLYKTKDGVQCETEEDFTLLDHNRILEEVVKLYNLKIEKADI